MPIKRLRNGIFIESNTKRFTEFTNCNLSQRLVELTSRGGEGGQLAQILGRYVSRQNQKVDP